MTYPPEQPFRGVEYPPLEQSPPAANPYGAVDYPANYPPMPPPAYPPPVYPQTPVGPYPGYPAGYPSYPGGYPTYPIDPYDPYRSARPPGTNGQAIASLVCALAGLLLCGLPSIAGLILGVIGMRETKRTGQNGYGIALAATIIGALVTLFWVVYLVFAVAFATTHPSA